MNERRSDSSGGVVDFHNHVMPGVDDGAPDAAATREALHAMHEDGVRIVVASPHVTAGAHGTVAGDRLAELDRGWEELAAIAEEVSGIEVRRGAEVRLDSAAPVLDDARIRLAGGPFVLVEFPFFVVPPRSARVLEHIRSAGWWPIVAHPERYTGLDAELAVAQEWRDVGAFLQLNGPSLLGRYGTEVQRMAEQFLALGRIDYISSDYHARGRPRVAEVLALLATRGFAAQAETLMCVNPLRMVNGELPLPVGAVDVAATVDRNDQPSDREV